MTEPFVLDRDVPRAVVQVRAARVPAVLATVVETTGSTPQEPGARLLVLADGQQAGTVGGGAVKGYLEEVKVPPDSRTETFVALRTEVQNWRWAGVPFYLRTGKRLSARDAQIVITFREVPHPIFPGTSRANKLVIKLQPEDGLELHLLAVKGGRPTSSGPELLSPVSLDLDFDKTFASERVGAYERLLMDAIAGRLNLFVRSDEQEQAWRWVEPVLQAWASDPTGPRPYSAGGWGPAAASAMIARDGCTWAEEQ
jgi:glucose-6-phosphate 1-dehydrogenase